MNDLPLPSHLAGRVAPVSRKPIHAGGAFVLYWMVTAARAHENPALDTALVAGRALGLPVFVYHALSERHPFASDRHHRFILDGARRVRVQRVWTEPDALDAAAGLIGRFADAKPPALNVKLSL